MVEAQQRVNHKADSVNCHYAAEYPSSARSGRSTGKGKGRGKSMSGRGGRGRAPEIECYECGEVGHFARDCPTHEGPSRAKGKGGKVRGKGLKGAKGGAKGGGGRGRRARGPAFEDEVPVFISNIPNALTWQDLRDLFNQDFRVAHANVATHADGSSRGFGVVKFFSEADAAKAASMLDGETLGGRLIEAHIDRTIVGHGDQGWQERHEKKMTRAEYCGTGGWDSSRDENDSEERSNEGYLHRRHQ